MSVCRAAVGRCGNSYAKAGYMQLEFRAWAYLHLRVACMAFSMRSIEGERHVIHRKTISCTARVEVTSASAPGAPGAREVPMPARQTMSICVG